MNHKPKAKKGVLRPPTSGMARDSVTGAPIAVSQRHLLLVAVSPVQKFVAAARRMRDLAYGSRLLSTLGEALALELQKTHGAELVFPARAAYSKDAVARCTNKIMCVLPRSKQPAQVMQALRLVFEQQLQNVRIECLQTLGKGHDTVDAVLVDSLEAQITTYLHLFGAWAQVRGEAARDYAKAYRQAQRLLDARKGLRDFGAPAARPGWLLSSLDGERDSVLADGHLPFARASKASNPVQRAAVARLRKRYQIDAAEQVDAMGLVKRVLGTEAKFPALIRVAFQPWVAQWACNDALPDDHDPALPRLRDIETYTQVLVGHELARRNGLGPADGPAATHPFDGGAWLASRRGVARRDNAQLDPAAREALGALDHIFRHEPACASEEGIYVAVLVADGDHLGSVILDEAAEELPPAQCHRDIAKALQAVAEAAIVTVQEFGGHALYAGGDDLLAVLPVQSALSCAEALRTAYAATLGAALPNGLKGEATLSVGIGVGHVVEPMGRLLDLARQACQLAKDGPDGQGLRNALGLAVQPRHGTRVQIARHWATPGSAAGMPVRLVERLERWRDSFANGGVSGSLPYDLVQLVDDEPADALIGATRRLFERRGLDHQDAKPLLDDIEAHWRHCGHNDVGVRVAARTLADELYLCRWLAAHPRPAQPPRTATAGAAAEVAVHAAAEGKAPNDTPAPVLPPEG